MDFVALDFETANASLSSICQIGAVSFQSGVPTARFTTLIDPEDFFDGMNVSIHGIDEEAVKGAPTLPQVFERLTALLSGRIVVSHTHFDRIALAQAVAKNGLQSLQCHWLDSAKVARRTWSELARVGYGLASIAARLGIDFQHHDACADAEVCGRVMVQAISDSGVTLDEWLLKTARPLSEVIHGRLARTGNANGPLFGECVVFTGELNITRHEAAAIASDAGCSVAAAVSKKASILVTGNQDIAKLRPGECRSSKYRLAEKLILDGHQMRIIGESDFMMLCGIQPEAHATFRSRT